MAWSYAIRPHEGEVLETLQGVNGVVRFLGLDAPNTEKNLNVDHIQCNFKLVAISSEPPPRTRPLAAITTSQKSTPNSVTPMASSASIPVSTFRRLQREVGKSTARVLETGGRTLQYTYVGVKLWNILEKQG